MPDNADPVVTPIFSVVIPAYNSGDSLVELCDRLERVFSEVMQESYELIIVNDGSSNPVTWPTIERIARRPHVVAINLMRNYGKPGAVMCGIAHAAGRWVVTIDDDLQQLPEDIPKLAALRAHDVVVGEIGVKQHSWWIRFSSRIKARFDRIILGVPCPMSPLKLISAEVAQGMQEISTPRPFIPALLCSVTKDIVSVPIRHKTSRIDSSRYSLFKRFSQFSNLLIGNSSLLLRGIGIIGATAAVAGFIFALYTVSRILLGEEIVPGWASLIIINLTFGGLILIALGINGEYLLRILEHSSSRPAYRVRRLIRSKGHCTGETKSDNSQMGYENGPGPAV